MKGLFEISKLLLSCPMFWAMLPAEKSKRDTLQKRRRASGLRGLKDVVLFLHELLPELTPEWNSIVANIKARKSDEDFYYLLEYASISLTLEQVIYTQS